MQNKNKAEQEEKYLLNPLRYKSIDNILNIYMYIYLVFKNISLDLKIKRF